MTNCCLLSDPNDVEITQVCSGLLLLQQLAAPIDAGAEVGEAVGV